jgi:hypothetical protein
MKWYLSFVVTLLLGTIGYQVVEMMRWTPSLDALSHTTSVTALAQLGYTPHGGRISSSRPLLLDGRTISCGIGLQDCVSRFRGLRDGEPLDATLVYVPKGHDGFWLAMWMRRANGDNFSNSPQQIVDAWKSTARGNILLTALAVVLFLLVYPACTSERFRQAWWAMVEPVRSQESAAPD